MIAIMELKWRFWFEKDGMLVLGKGGAEILRAIKEHGSISAAARSLGMSYRFVWKYLKRMESVLGSPVVERERGGKTGGGTKLTPLGETILEQYNHVEEYLRKISDRVMDDGLEDREIKGIIKRIKTDKNSATVEIETASTIIKAVFDDGAVRNLKEGDAIIIMRMRKADRKPE